MSIQKNMITNNFCVFILTHGRPNKVITYRTLRRMGYTGKIYIVIDNEDKTADEYYQIFKGEVIMFDKKAIADRIDQGDNFNDRRAVIYARNACFDIASQVGVEYFMELDDDYNDFRFKCNAEQEYIHRKGIKDLDALFTSLLEFYQSIPALSIAIAQGGDFMGGKNSGGIEKPRFRKCMNTFICSTGRPFQWSGRINEDVNTYVTLGGRGELFLTIYLLAIQQEITQKSTGGMTELYIDSGTYIKSFYTVMYSPSNTKVVIIKQKNQRLHHHINWETAVPMILDEKYKKD